jgi:hypothetical protein
MRQSHVKSAEITGTEGDISMFELINHVEHFGDQASPSLSGITGLIALNQTDDTGQRSSLAKMASADLVQTNGLGLACARRDKH